MLCSDVSASRAIEGSALASADPVWGFRFSHLSELCAAGDARRRCSANLANFEANLARVRPPAGPSSVEAHLACMYKQGFPRTLPGFLSMFPASFPTAPSSSWGNFTGKPSIFPSLRLFWGQNQQNRQNTGYFAGIPDKPRGYRADFLNFASDFAPEQLSDSGKLASFPRETREKQNGAPKHPLASLETSGNAKCWGPSGFPLGCRKPLHRPKAHTQIRNPHTLKRWRRKRQTQLLPGRGRCAVAEHRVHDHQHSPIPFPHTHPTQTHPPPHTLFFGWQWPTHSPFIRIHSFRLLPPPAPSARSGSSG